MTLVRILSLAYRYKPEKSPTRRLNPSSMVSNCRTPSLPPFLEEKPQLFDEDDAISNELFPSSIISIDPDIPIDVFPMSLLQCPDTKEYDQSRTNLVGAMSNKSISFPFATEEEVQI
eukprot:CAMPEP_0184689282 /NCGR_PEP_ID=MMETSP0312-20130426/30569_1 /TAXON_ID=31354 /ORGANISM="Compsopogon coeruleus, Strain SAG 36.94" /LENGTH=116 /DNA_ID=CAMNT_0027146613 /DNA_START=2195 /DNA_END=2545 /DNA_ORIENTATION=+